MGVYTNIDFYNSNDPEFIKARDGTPEQREKWEDENGSIEYRPGARIRCEEGEGYIETDEEYGGWIIPVDKIPKGTTHIVVHRG